MPHLPAVVRAGVEAALSGADRRSVRSVAPVGGGCINHGARLLLDDGATYFLKWNPAAPSGLFGAEWDGLEALAGAGSLRVPTPMARGGDDEGPEWLLMEYLEPGRPGKGFSALLGRGLAKLHRSVGERAPFGWDRDNWIGSLPQDNGACSSWGDFWRDRRILPQLERARYRGHFAGSAGRAMDRLVDAVPLALEDLGPGEACHLLHGDLWNGNVFAQQDGSPALIDPAVFRGHGEVDLSMSELFGGFGEDFFAAYREVIPIPAAYDAFRRDLYQLYYLLVHLNLFGASYEAGSLAAARRVVAEVAE